MWQVRKEYYIILIISYELPKFSMQKDTKSSVYNIWFN